MILTHERISVTFALLDDEFGDVEVIRFINNVGVTCDIKGWYIPFKTVLFIFITSRTHRRVIFGQLSCVFMIKILSFKPHNLCVEKVTCLTKVILYPCLGSYQKSFPVIVALIFHNLFTIVFRKTNATEKITSERL